MTEPSFNNHGGIINTGNSTNFGTQIIGTQNNAAQDPAKELSYVAEEIKKLIDELSQKYPVETELEQEKLSLKVVKEIELRPKLKTRLTKAIKTSGIAAFKEAMNNPVFTFVATFYEEMFQR